MRENIASSVVSKRPAVNEQKKTQNWLSSDFEMPINLNDTEIACRHPFTGGRAGIMG